MFVVAAVLRAIPEVLAGRYPVGFDVNAYYPYLILSFPSIPALEMKHRDMGSIWLPDSGRGALSPELETWFRTSLARITAARDDAPLVFYCRVDCWMSWNATKRALEWGYRAASWYRDGTDGWSEAALPLAEAQPPSDAPH